MVSRIIQLSSTLKLCWLSVDDAALRSCHGASLMYQSHRERYINLVVLATLGRHIIWQELHSRSNEKSKTPRCRKSFGWNKKYSSLTMLRFVQFLWWYFDSMGQYWPQNDPHILFFLSNPQTLKSGNSFNWIFLKTKSKRDKEGYRKGPQNGIIWSQNAVFSGFKDLFIFSIEYGKEHWK